MSDDIPRIQPEAERRSLWQRLSVVWLVPLAALLIALGVAWQTWSSQGPVIVITFDEALGVKARETELRYRDVTVGRVEQVQFSSDLGHVEVSVRVDKKIAPFVDSDAAFWVVRPEVSARGVSGLDTVLSGVFVEGVWDTIPDGLVEEHTGLDTAPLLRPGQKGTEFVLRAQRDTALAEGTAITYKGIEVGRVGKPEITAGSEQASARAVVFAPHDKLLSSATRFWDISGFSFSIGASGADLDFTSLASLISGGIAFETLVSGGRPITGREVFELYPSEDQARDAVFEADRGIEATLSVVFEENASGLVVGSPVRFNGIEIGEVTEVTGLVDPLRFGDRRVRLQVLVSISAGPLGFAELDSAEAILDFMDAQIQEGLRARLASASILTGGLRVELLTVDDAPADALDYTARPHPAIPTTSNEIADAGETVQGVLQRVNNLPVEDLMASAMNFLDASTELARNGDLAQLPADLRGILGDVRGITSSSEVQGLPGQITALLSDLQAASASVQNIVTSIENAQAVDRFMAAIDNAGAAAQAVTDSTQGVPDLVESLSATAETARNLPLEELIGRASDIVATADALLSDPGTKDLPARLSASLQELQYALQELREGGAIRNLNATLNSAQEAAAAVQEATKSLPEISRRLDATLVTASRTLESFDGQSEFSRVARQALSEIARAAKAVESLSRTLERQPNSILLGR